MFLPLGHTSGSTKTASKQAHNGEPLYPARNTRLPLANRRETRLSKSTTVDSRGQRTNPRQTRRGKRILGRGETQRMRNTAKGRQTLANDVMDIDGNPQDATAEMGSLARLCGRPRTAPCRMGNGR